MIKVYIGELLKYSYIPLLYPNLGFKAKLSHLFSFGAFRHYKNSVLEIVNNPEKADFLLIPHNYFFIKSNKEYIKQFVSISERHNKKIIVFAQGDSDEEIKISNSIVFRTSQYRYKKKRNEVMMPAFAEDLSDDYEFQPRVKRNGAPIVGFCGWAGFDNPISKIKYYVKNLFHFGIKKQGLWFRRKAIKILSDSKLVEPNFIVRKSYSGHKSTIELPLEKARLEYAKNIMASDFILVTKGDGNFSFRFYEALSAGRIPLFINTDCVLPLEDLIDYSGFVLFTDYRKIDKIDKIAADFYGNINNEKFSKTQKAARAVFEEYLRIDKFFEIMFLKKKINEYL